MAAATACYSIETFEKRTAAAEGLSLILRPLNRVRFALGVYVLLQVLQSMLRSLIKDTKSLPFENLEPDQAERVAARLAELSKRLNETLDAAEGSRAAELWLLRGSFARLSNFAATLEDILENWYLYLNADFRKLVAESIDELKSSKRPSEENRSLAPMSH